MQAVLQPSPPPSAWGPESQSNPCLYYRSLQPSDYDQLKALHVRLFPIDYEDAFYQRAVNSQDRIFSFVAIQMLHGEEQVVGFVTARLVYLYECDPKDRHIMGLSSKALDSEYAIYVLTLGVAEDQRHRGIAACLLENVRMHALNLRCHAVFLHVISYNEAAIRLYSKASYACAGHLPNFYTIVSGRQPDPTRTTYDAYLYVLHLVPPAACVAPWPYTMLGAAAAPLRNALGHFNACMPWFCRPHSHPAIAAIPPIQHYPHASDQSQSQHHQNGYSQAHRNGHLSRPPSSSSTNGMSSLHAPPRNDISPPSRGLSHTSSTHLHHPQGTHHHHHSQHKSLRQNGHHHSTHWHQPYPVKQQSSTSHAATAYGRSSLLQWLLQSEAPRTHTG